ncbi:DNA (cytosine-5)-methyltransferase 1 [Bacilli bacterium PM5-3]|nr:DNA (cytosine-5)-methyltransferase 1 [Bacilli bacterium PM5-3]MDH6604151.1 DNA (cytosine-5)-methyltransferase 1 [Bacilli bacterium PM5-9]
MLKVIETFSGIGAQAKALNNLECEYEIVFTADWDITAIIAYDLIHNGEQKLGQYEKMSKENLLKKISSYSFSLNGKDLASKSSINRLSVEILKRLNVAIDRTKNLVNVQDISGATLPNDIDVLTYSFPCQDLSNAGSWHGNTGGINRDAKNRSSMLWEIERILLERYNNKLELPRFLLMENVRSIKSKKHIDNFKEWQESLEGIGYYNKIYSLNSKDFGIPQNRERMFMVSFYVGNNCELKNKIKSYLDKNNLKNLKCEMHHMKDFLKTDYRNTQYLNEAILSNPNDTPSRKKIFENNILIYDEQKYCDLVATLTTKQDRHPNSGVITFKGKKGKSQFRYLTPREAFLLMGFQEKDYQVLIDNNFSHRKNSMFFSLEKLHRLAGNSIVVNILEEVFKQIIYVKKNIYEIND